jgi:XTP/dITP diphosphohydrolase
MKQLVLASNNPGKAREFHDLLAPLGLEVLPQSTFSVPPIDEPYPGFVENALHKARHAARHSGLPALADDSGLCVAALGGEPGVHSARYAGEPKSDARNNALLLERLEGVADRRAYFYCVLALVKDATDPRPLIADGEWHGEILTAPRGQAGFGYDPLFLVPDLGQTAAELDSALKNTLSHRGGAMRHLLDRLRVHPL